MKYHVMLEYFELSVHDTKDEGVRALMRADRRYSGSRNTRLVTTEQLAAERAKKK